jgi:hypothetical protein
MSPFARFQQEIKSCIKLLNIGLLKEYDAAISLAEHAGLEIENTVEQSHG